MSRRDALIAMTIGAAYASFTDLTNGSLEAKKKADFVILNQDIMNVPYEDILISTVKAVILDGRNIL